MRVARAAARGAAAAEAVGDAAIGAAHTPVGEVPGVPRRPQPSGLQARIQTLVNPWRARTTSEYTRIQGAFKTWGIKAQAFDDCAHLEDGRHPAGS